MVAVSELSTAVYLELYVVVLKAALKAVEWVDY
jgi:hypothetical protein